MAIHASARGLALLKPPGSYLPLWEELYHAIHNTKGVMQILKTPEKMQRFLLSFHQTILAATTGPQVVRSAAEVAARLVEIADHLDKKTQNPDFTFLEKKLREIESLYTNDLSHEKRIETIPENLYYVNDFVSKKVREIQVLGWNHCIVEDEILLEQIPFWRAQLQESLALPSKNQGLLVNFLPFINSEGSKTLKVWAWVAAPTDSRAALKQRIKEEMPKVKITSLKLKEERD